MEPIKLSQSIKQILLSATNDKKNVHSKVNLHLEILIIYECTNCVGGLEKLYAVSKQNVVLSIFQPCDEKFGVCFKTSFLLLLLFVEC